MGGAMLQRILSAHQLCSHPLYSSSLRILSTHPSAQVKALGVQLEGEKSPLRRAAREEAEAEGGEEQWLPEEDVPPRGEVRCRV